MLQMARGECNKKILNARKNSESVSSVFFVKIRDHHDHAEFIGPAFFIKAAAFEMHPLDIEDRTSDLKKKQGIGLCNITKCCTKVCPEHITITDNAIIPLKERVVDEFYDPLTKLFKMFKPNKSS